MLADEAEGKAALLQFYRANNLAYEAMILERYVTIKASPEIWAELGSQS